MADNRVIGAFLSVNEPTAEEKIKLAEFFRTKLDRPVDIVWVKDESVKKGFVLKILNEVYDNTPEGLLRSLKTAIDETDKSGDYISLVKETVGKWKPRALP